uniref:LSM14 domain-containing protein n=1 Tax=Parastrongyloides trichosuri TaxID=131310 RepID=A0A0N4ZKQ0_PARTI
MSLDFIGYLVSIECTSKCTLEGRISSLDQENNAITIVEPLMNGKRLNKNKITVRNSEIVNLRIVDKPTIDDVVSILNVDPQKVLDEDSDDPIIDVNNITKISTSGNSPTRIKSPKPVKFLTENDILNASGVGKKVESTKTNSKTIPIKYLTEEEVLFNSTPKQLLIKNQKPAIIPVYEDNKYVVEDVRTKQKKKQHLVKDVLTTKPNEKNEKNEKTEESPNKDSSNNSTAMSKKFGGVKMIPTSCMKSMNKKGMLNVLADAFKQELCTKNVTKDNFIENISPCNIQTSNNTVSSEINEHKVYGQFKYFPNPQVPDPVALEALKQKKNGGETTSNEKSYGKTKNYRNSKYDNDFDITLDYDLVNTDFDFDTNLSKFNEDMKDLDLDITISTKKKTKNYAHDENILNDPTRIKSWTMKTRKTVPSFKSLFIQPVTSGFDLPFFSLADKKAFINEGIKFLGSEIIYSTLADRLFTFVIESSCRCEFTLQDTVIIGDSNSDPTLIKKLSIHLSNRSYNQDDSKSQVTFFGIHPDSDFPEISYINSAKQLSLDTRCIILLTDDTNSLPKDLSLWLTRMGNGPNAAHVFAIDFEPIGLSQVHVLFTCFGHDSSSKAIGHGKHFNTRVSTCSSPTLRSETSTSNSQHNSRNVCNVMFDSDAAICDLGIPLSWVDAESRQALSQIFATQFLFRL